MSDWIYIGIHFLPNLLYFIVMYVMWCATMMIDCWDRKTMSLKTSQLEVANLSLLAMTVWNAVLGIAMIAEIIPVVDGMFLAFGGMCGIVFAAWRTLMHDERPWESPSRYRMRKQSVDRTDKSV